MFHCIPDTENHSGEMSVKPNFINNIFIALPLGEDDRQHTCTKMRPKYANVPRVWYKMRVEIFSDQKVVNKN